MGRRRRALGPLAAVSLVAANARLAAADDTSGSPSQAPLEIYGEGSQTWDSVLREIQDTTGALGRTYALGVRSSGATVGCGDYALTFDDVGRAAFVVEGCDIRSGVTRIRVTSRAALFDESGFVPRPRRASVYAVLTQHARADGGGARPEGGSRVGCSVRLEPYLWDSLHGVAVPLPWDRFELRPLSEDVHAAPDGAGWIARGESRMSTRFRYEVVDRKTGEKVVDNEATLVCEDKPVSATARADLPHDEWPPLRALLPSPSLPVSAPSAPSLPSPPSPGDTRDHSVASLKLRVVDLALLRNDAARFRGAFQLGPYNGANDFAGGFQLGITNTAGVHPWGLPAVPTTKGARTQPVPDVDTSSRPQAFRGLAQVGVINAVDDNFSGVLQLGGVVTFVDGSFRGFAQIGVLGAGMGGDSVAALQFGGLVVYAKEITGIQLSPCLAFAETVRGIQIGGCGTIVTRSVAGLQVGGGNMVFETSAKRGEIAPPATVDGAQVGTWNYATLVHGAQVGAVNIGGTIHGVQVGAINYASHLRGIQIGAINIAANGVVPFMPVMNAAFDG